MPSPTFISIVKKQKQITQFFYILFIVQILLTVIGMWSLYTGNSFAYTFVDIGYLFGKAAIVVYILTLIPGICRRLKFQAEPIALLMIFRRQVGILMYLLVFAHFWFLFGIDVLLSGSFPLPPQPQVIFGMLANYILFALAITSNDWATKKLGIWWNRLHKLTHIALWLIFAHVAFIDFSIWTVLMGGTGIVVLFSHLYPRLQKQSK